MTSLSCKAIGAVRICIPTGGEDYFAINGLVLEFEAKGERSQVVRVNITDDLLCEGPENFFGTLSDVSGEGLVQFSQSTAELIIADNDSEYIHPILLDLNLHIISLIFTVITLLPDLLLLFTLSK